MSSLALPRQTKRPISIAGVSESDINAKLGVNSAHAIESLKLEIESILYPLVVARSLSEFMHGIEERFQNYSRLMDAMVNIVLSTSRGGVLEEFSYSMFDALRPMVIESRASLGARGTDEVLFALSNLRRTMVLADQTFPKLITQYKSRSTDLLIREYGTSLANAVFYLDCVRIVSVRGVAVQPDVLDHIITRMRESTMQGYASVRQLADHEPELALAPVGCQWDNEDESWIRDSGSEAGLELA